MAGKPKGVSRDATLTLRLPGEVHDKIKAAAGERSVSEVIRGFIDAGLTGDFPIAGDHPLKPFIGTTMKCYEVVTAGWGDFSDLAVQAVFWRALRTHLNMMLEMVDETRPVKPQGNAPRDATTIERAAEVAFHASIIW